MEKRRRALLFLVITAILWSLGGLLIKSICWNPLAIAGARSLVAAAVMLAYIRKPRFTWSGAQIGGALAYAGTVILFVTANKWTTAANAILLQYTAPVYTAILGSWFLKEKTPFMDWITIGVVLGAMGLFFMDRLSMGGMAGNICAILSGICFSATALFLRCQKDDSPLESLIIGNLVTAAIGLPFLAYSASGLSNWGILLVLGVFQLGIPYILYAEAIRHVDALEAILIPVIEPVLNPAWVFLAMGEVPGPWAVLGGTLILLSITGRCVIKAVQSPPHAIRP